MGQVKCLIKLEIRLWYVQKAGNTNHELSVSMETIIFNILQISKLAKYQFYPTQ